MPFNQRPAIVLPIAVLLIAGGISYTVVEDLLKRRRFVRLALDSKLVLVTSAALVVLGTVAVLSPNGPIPTRWVTRRSGHDCSTRSLPG